MFLSNEINFKEINIKPNEDSTLKVEINGVKLQDQDGLDANITYHRVKTTLQTIDMFSKHSQIDIEILKDNEEEDKIFSIFIPDKIDCNNFKEEE